MAAGEARGSATVRVLLRSLAVGLAVHRLYPDNPGASSFVAACERIAAATGEALAAGPVSIEVRSARFVVGDDTISDPGIDRFAQACFERRVELVGFQSVPSPLDLQVWFTLLSSDADEIEREDGMAAALELRGVSSVVTTARTPAPAEGREPRDLLGLSDWTVAAVSARHSEPEHAGEQDPFHLEAGETGPQLYERLAELSEDLADGGSRSSFFQRAASVVAELPRAERAVLGITLFDRLDSEGFAERYVGHLTDVALAELVHDVAWFLGRDPAELASDIAVRAGRHATLEGLFATGAFVLLEPVDVDGVDDLPDDGALLAEFPDLPAQERGLAMVALVDVLLCEPREAHLAQIVDNVIAHLRDAVVAGAPELVEELLGALDAATDAGPPELRRALARARAEALDTAVVTEACAASASSGATDPPPRQTSDPTPDATPHRVLDPDVFVPFGSHAIPPLIGALAEQLDGPSRPRLLEVLAVVGAGHSGAVAASLDRQRPELVVRLVPIVGRATGADIVSLSSDLASRAQPEVLHAVLDTLATQDPARAAPVIVRIVRRVADTELQHHGIDVLARLPARSGQPFLQELAVRDGTAALPRRTRRRAKRAARKAARTGRARKVGRRS